MRWQPRIVRCPEPDRYIVEPFALNAIGELVSDARLDILREHPPLRSDRAREAHRVIALSGSDVGGPHAATNPGKLHDLLCLTEPIARIFGRESIADDRRDIPLGRGKLRLPGLLAAGKQQEPRERGRPTPHPRLRLSPRSPVETGLRP